MRSASARTLHTEATPTRARIEVIDVVRGFALFGILAVNIGDFSSPAQYFGGLRLWTSSTDFVAQWITEFFCDGRFYPLFSLLFGVGFGIQMYRLEQRGAPFRLIYAKRLLVLLVIGLLHGIFLWWGDVLAVYAFYGAVLLLLRRLSQKTILALSVIVLIVPIGISVVRLTDRTARAEESRLLDPKGITLSDLRDSQRQKLSALTELYAQGTYGQILNHRLGELQTNYQGWMYRVYGADVFGMFLLGLFLARAQVFQNPGLLQPAIRAFFFISGGITLAGLAISVVQHFAGLQYSEDFDFWIFQFFKIERIMQSLFYCCAILLLMQLKIARVILSSLALSGRMALTNYLMQSLVCTTVCYGYGFQWYGRVSPAEGLALTVLFFSAQVLMSRWWMRRFRFGPMEWVWKSLTYGAPQPFRIVAVED